MPQKKIGIMGGTFDPIHIGHLILAECAWQAFGLDVVLFMPSGHSYFKDHRTIQVTEARKRLAMVELAVADNPHFAVSDMEIRRCELKQTNTYTYETLEELGEKEKGAALYFIAGADTLLSMRTWKEPGRIFSRCTVLAAGRADAVTEEALQKETAALRREYGAQILELAAPEIALSSTYLRERVREGASVRYLIPESVAAYMKQEKLYC